MRHLVRFLTIFAVAALCTGLPASTSAQPGGAMLQGIPLLRQQHALTCEASATSMATRAQVSERQIMGTLPRNRNPNLGFRGNPDGEQGRKLIDYGVYALPLQAVMARYGYRTDVSSYRGDNWIRANVNRGWAVVAWVTYQLQYAAPRLAADGGSPFFLVPHEHAVTIVGYSPAGVIANDPWTARRVSYGWNDFNRAWGYFANMALAVEPCPAPLPVSNLSAPTVSSAGITWTWDRAPNAVQYDVTIVRHAGSDTVVYQGRQADTQFTLGSPSPGKRYEISVTSVSRCGGTSDPVRLIVQMPKAINPPTATPVEGTVVPTPSITPVTAVATPSATQGPRPVATATPAP